jgi:plastocyanin
MRGAIRAGLTAAAAAGALGGGLTAVADSAPQAVAANKKPKPRTVDVFDNYYAPARLTIKAGTKVTWKWPVDVGDSHDVETRKVPKGARKFASPPYAAGAKWSRTFKKPGRYQLYCSFHETEMTMTITVKKK